MVKGLRLAAVTLLFMVCLWYLQSAARDLKPAAAPGKQAAPTLSPLKISVKLAKVNKKCEVQDPGAAYLKAGQTIHWVIENGCQADQTVGVVNFQLKSTPPVDLFPFDKGKTDCVARAGASCQITLVVLPKDPKGGHGNFVYTYGFNISGKDPELVIEWP